MRAFFTLLLAIVACKRPVYNDELGVTPILAKEGSLAGTFALRSINALLVSVPILGDLEGGGDNLRLIKRTWDPATKTYLQRSQLCGGQNFPVFGVITAAPESTYRLVPESTNEVVSVDHDTGAYLATGHVQLWALRDLADPINDPLPKTVPEAKGDFYSHIYDMDGDGHEGFTFNIKGQGSVYVFQRKTIDFRGVILGPDRAIGVGTNVNETLTLSYRGSPLLDRQTEGSSRPNPDPLRSWFDEVRIPDDSDCDTVKAASLDGRLAAEAPFEAAKKATAG